MRKNSPEAIAAFEEARERLEWIAERDAAAGVDWETDEYLDANAAVAEAERNVSWWRRW